MLNFLFNKKGENPKDDRYTKEDLLIEIRKFIDKKIFNYADPINIDKIINLINTKKLKKESRIIIELPDDFNGVCLSVRNKYLIREYFLEKLLKDKEVQTALCVFKRLEPFAGSNYNYIFPKREHHKLTMVIESQSVRYFIEESFEQLINKYNSQL
jgi:hypothetical protein